MHEVVSNASEVHNGRLASNDGEPEQGDGGGRGTCTGSCSQPEGIQTSNSSSERSRRGDGSGGGGASGHIGGFGADGSGNSSIEDVNSSGGGGSSPIGNRNSSSIGIGGGASSIDGIMSGGGSSGGSSGVYVTVEGGQPGGVDWDAADGWSPGLAEALGGPIAGNGGVIWITDAANARKAYVSGTQGKLLLVSSWLCPGGSRCFERERGLGL